ncbi:LppP/LprE family lipoprotein [Rhodococcus sp. MEB064]|uniref:LppP/LprE family lipoprotein n=1 Tax=Rhodococcus sp. MEB064 TaxID=1587522 RepID=UPI000695F304|nr:LppP/LprE family lipoprotein [Rhodococcus sp. MEB064]
MRRTLLATLAVTALFASGCSDSGQGSAAPPPPPATTTSTAVAPAPGTEPASTAAPEPSTACVEDSVVAAGIESLPQFFGSGWRLVRQGDPCATLSWALAALDGGTGSSPWTVLFFHDDTYLGTATALPYSFTDVDSQTDDTVTVSYGWLREGESTAEQSGGPGLVRYTWNGSSVVMLDDLPQEVVDGNRQTPADPCLDDDVIDAAIASLPTFSGSGWTRAGQGDACSVLAWALAVPDGATGSSPTTVLFFHDGVYLGTATARPYAFTAIDPYAQLDDTVTVSYRWLRDGEATAEVSGGPALVRYRWNGSSVDMLDSLPPEVTNG